MVETPPTTWDELREVGGALVDSGEADAAIGLPDLTYNSYPIYTSYGGYIFGQDADGMFTSDDIGMANEGMIAGITYIGSLVDEGLIPENVDWEAAHVLFETGRQPFIMTGPWALNRFRDAGVPYAVAHSLRPRRTENPGIRSLACRASSSAPAPISCCSPRPSRPRSWRPRTRCRGSSRPRRGRRRGRR